MYLKMNTICLTFIVLHMYTQASIVNAFQEPIQRCPRMCICGLYMRLNMANCSGEHLISANIGMSSLVEFLDLSHNDITTIDNQCFKDLQHLESILLSRNSISFIELDAFSQLPKLKSVNLTYNRLESFDNRIFEQNFHLITVDLSGNKFMHLPNKPILISSSIEILHLHSSQLTHLHVNYFGELPNIKYIDLSGNLLIILNLAAFATNNRLRDINLCANRMKCDEQTEMSIIWLKRNYVTVSMDNCPKKEYNDHPLTFERLKMALSPKNFTQSSSEKALSNTSTDLNRLWKPRIKYDRNIPILNKRCNVNESTISYACHLFEMCASNFTMLIEEVEVKLYRKSENIKNEALYEPEKFYRTWYDLITVQVAFYGGMLFGTIFGIIILLTLKLISDCVINSNTKNIYRVRIRKRNQQNDTVENYNTNENNEMIVSNNAILDLRTNSVRRRETNDANEQSRQTSTSFFAIFYERPVRRRYYRQINRSATNLVRRLSQSRLFLNTRAQTVHRNADRDRQEILRSNREHDESEIICVDSNECVDTELIQNTLHRISASVHSMHIDLNERENQLNTIRICYSESDIFRREPHHQPTNLS